MKERSNSGFGKQFNGAGGTSGGIGEFFIGLTMFIVGVYIFLSNITVTNGFSFSTVFFRVGGGFGVDIVSGMIFIPFIFGIGMVFYNKKNLIGWVLTIGSIVLMMIGIIVSLRFYFKPMNAFSIIILLILIFGGAGLFLKSLKEHDKG
jgi:hypothetical protein